MNVPIGATILRINLSPAIQPLSGQLNTKDGYTRDYQITLKLWVSNPALFAEEYHRKSDPVYLAKVAIEGELSRYAGMTYHDNIEENDLRHYVEVALTMVANKHLGISA